MCDEIAAIAAVDVTSIYVVEGDAADRLVMRGNHGFPPAAIGAVTLRVGEGITGMVAECMRPVSAAHAASEAAFKPIAGLGEERFPAFAGVPLIGGGRVIGVLVLQRRTSRAFTAADVALATALGAPVTLALERRRAAAMRTATLTGTGLGGGLVLGRAAIVPTATALGGAPADVGRAAHRLRDDAERAGRRLRAAPDEVGAALDRLTLALLDQRLRDRLAEAAARPAGLREVARDYARTPYRLGADPSIAPDAEARAFELEELCVLFGTALDPAAPLRAGAVWIAARLGAFVALAAVGRGAAALVAAGPEISPAALAIARAARLPLVSDAHGIFGWARPGDLLAVDADAGSVLVNPAAADIERVRRARAA
jgi:phosphotransferase system, enzyme I, PtsP